MIAKNVHFILLLVTEIYFINVYVIHWKKRLLIKMREVKAMRARNEARNQKALEMRRSGMMYKDIAKELGLCPSRTWLIVQNQMKWEQEKTK